MSRLSLKKADLLPASLGTGVLSALLILTFTARALAGGYAIPYQSAKAVGLGNALTAGVEDPSAVYINPGALSEVEDTQILATLNYVNVVSSVTNSGRKSINRADDHLSLHSLPAITCPGRI